MVGMLIAITVLIAVVGTIANEINLLRQFLKERAEPQQEKQLADLLG
jgi:hypothetical protein